MLWKGLGTFCYLWMLQRLKEYIQQELSREADASLTHTAGIIMWNRFCCSDSESAILAPQGCRLYASTRLCGTDSGGSPSRPFPRLHTRCTPSLHKAAHCIISIQGSIVIATLSERAILHGKILPSRLSFSKNNSSL